MSEGNGVQRELGGIQESLKNIGKQLDSADTRRRQIYEKLEEQAEEISNLKHDVAAVKGVVDEIQPDVADYRALKAKGIGILAGAALVGGGAATGIKAVLVKLGIMSP